MDLHFCDICNESVPQADLDQGRAFFRQGRVVCARCESAMGGIGGEEGGVTPSSGAPGASRVAEPARGAPSPPVFSMAPRAGSPTGPLFVPPPPPRSSVGGLLLVGLMAAAALVVSSIVTVVLVERIQESGRKASSEVALAERRTSRAIDDLERTLAGWREDDRAERDREHEALRASEESQRARTTARLDALDTRLEALARLDARIDRLDQRLSAQSDDGRSLASEVAQLERDLGVLAERWAEALATGDVAPPSNGAVAAARRPEWFEHTRGLESPSAATRWSAVTALGETRDVAVVPHLVAMLVDPDIFVRMATARILGDLEGEEAIGPLIDALEDDEPAVREAVVVALRAITGQNFHYDPMANEADRARRVKSWRDWWKKQGRA